MFCSAVWLFQLRDGVGAAGTTLFDVVEWLSFITVPPFIVVDTVRHGVAERFN